MLNFKLLIGMGLVILSHTSGFAKSLKGAMLDFVCRDTIFKNPYIDIDKMLSVPVKCHYIHGGFADGTRFSFYFPEKKKYTGRFFQYITPFPDSETTAQAYSQADSLRIHILI